jgi:putative SOS response-associated peptidase YedK
MFNRYSITALPSSIELKFKTKIPDNYNPNFNASPDQQVPLILNDRTTQLTMARWGLESGIIKANESKTLIHSIHINSFISDGNLQAALLNHRCLVLADGFYIWKSITKKSYVPYRVISKNEKLFCFGGIWEEYGSDNIRFSILTRDSYKPVHEISDLMPVVLAPHSEMNWLRNNLSLKEIIYKMEIEDWDFFKYYPVSPKIKDPNLNSPSLIKMTPRTDQYGNLTLFD